MAVGGINIQEILRVVGFDITVGAMAKGQRLWDLTSGLGAAGRSISIVELVVAVVVIGIALVIDIATGVLAFSFSKSTKGLVASFAGKTFVRFLFASIFLGQEPFEGSFLFLWRRRIFWTRSGIRTLWRGLLRVMLLMNLTLKSILQILLIRKSIFVTLAVVIVAVGITVVVGIIWIAVIGISLCYPTTVASTWIIGWLIPNGRLNNSTGIGFGRRLRKVAVVGIASL